MKEEMNAKKNWKDWKDEIIATPGDILRHYAYCRTYDVLILNATWEPAWADWAARRGLNWAPAAEGQTYPYQRTLSGASMVPTEYMAGYDHNPTLGWPAWLMPDYASELTLPPAMVCTFVSVLTDYFQ